MAMAMQTVLAKERCLVRSVKIGIGVEQMFFLEERHAGHVPLQKLNHTQKATIHHL
jgi:ribosomal protein L19